MALIFEWDKLNERHFDPATDEAVIWADTSKGERFRLVIPRIVLQERFGVKRFAHSAAIAAILEHRKEFAQQAEAAFAKGALELVIS